MQQAPDMAMETEVLIYRLISILESHFFLFSSLRLPLVTFRMKLFSRYVPVCFVCIIIDVLCGFGDEISNC